MLSEELSSDMVGDVTELRYVQPVQSESTLHRANMGLC
jgi:hypothetical protein